MNFTAAGDRFAKSPKYSGMPTVVYGVLKRTNEIVKKKKQNAIPTVCQSVAQIARVGVMTRSRPFPLASFFSTPNSPPPSSSAPPTKRRKFNNLGATGA
ncbi:unnamed protein product [Linum trigynum]|uniref:Uncharacterized protein n=1 Tax=Linum trigynum TaxID=586398 RepID=A0AAV2DN48_9ROSI